MSESTQIAVNITLDVYSFITVGIILIYVLLRHSDMAENSKWLYLAFISVMFNAASDIFTWVCLGTAKAWYPAGLQISSFIYYLTSYTVVYCFFSFILDYLSKEGSLKKFFMFFSGLTMAVYAVMLICTPFTDWLYVIDAANNYERGFLFWIPVVFTFILFLSIIFLMIYNRKWIDFKNIYPFLSFYVFPYLMQLIQLFAYGVSLVGMGYTIAFIIIYFDMNLRLQRELNKSFIRLRERDARLIEMQEHTIISLSSLVEQRDTDTGGHVQRTREHVEHLAELLLQKGLFPETVNSEYVKELRHAAPMHDIGKIIVPDNVLKKAGRLTDDEFAQMKLHTTEGKRIIKDVFEEILKDEDSFRIIGEVATYHHEKWSGQGYPEGLKEGEIPLSARIMALADVFDALVSPRVYKEPMTYEQAFRIIEEGSGTHFDPVLTGVFLEHKDDFIAINEANLHPE